MGTSREVLYIFDKAIRLLAEKEKVYENSWKREGLRCMSASLYRKASGLEVMFRNGAADTNRDKVKEDLLDLMNYCALTYRLVEDSEEE